MGTELQLSEVMNTAYSKDKREKGCNYIFPLLCIALQYNKCNDPINTGDHTTFIFQMHVEEQIKYTEKLFIILSIVSINSVG